ncbi:MAG TPA: DNA polymerase III subunit delta [Verrucomicrobiae bacterium]|jgi:DNA polymerase-3 subunit delta|nr:DNA polymerase III subunit delta [Verrucomicrobiae bacterium]
MPAAKSASPLAFICGTDEFAVKKRAKEIFQDWAGESGDMDQEIIDAAVSNSGDALNAIAKLREAIQTLPFFGSSKIVWLRDCSFLGEERAASAQAVVDTLAELAAELKSFKWDKVRLLISAGKVDRRKGFFKTLEKIGSVENFEALSADDRDWAERAEGVARGAIRRRGKEISEEALAELVARVGPNTQQLENEAEKLALFLGARQKIEFGDVASICSRNKTARAFALGDALGDRDLPRLLKRLDEELWEMKFDSQKSPIGLLYGLISKVRAMLMLKEMLREGWVKPETDYNRFKAQLARVPAERLPADKRFNPLALNPYVLFRALPQAKRYSREELVRAMDLLLRCNRRLVSSGLDKAFMLQQIIVEIAAPQALTA